MTTAHHIIRQQFLHVELQGTEAEGLALQRTLSAFCREWLIPAIERGLEKYSYFKGSLYIDSLEIDAGILQMECLEKELPDIVSQAIEDSIRDQVASDELSSSNVSNQSSLVSFHQSIDECFIHFLKFGRLPWNFHLPGNGTLEQLILDSWREREPSVNERRSLPPNLLQILCEASARQRLARQFSEKFLETFVALFWSSHLPVVKSTLRRVNDAALPSTTRVKLQRQIWETTIMNITANRPSLADALVIEALDQWPLTLDEYMEVVAVMGSSGINIKPYPSKPKESAEVTPSLSLHPNFSNYTNQEPEQELVEGIYVGNAGLALLHPFLPQFFATLGLVVEDRIVSPDRCLSLLHFLATGHTTAPEYELLFPKVLCNIPLNYPPESEVELTDKEKEEAESLLNAVIRHWAALGETSPDGLRGTYLLRAGKISSLADGDLLLQVERKSFDILMDQLPWGVSMIKLPWMSRLLRVDWV